MRSGVRTTVTRKLKPGVAAEEARADVRALSTGWPPPSGDLMDPPDLQDPAPPGPVLDCVVSGDTGFLHG